MKTFILIITALCFAIPAEAADKKKDSRDKMRDAKKQQRQTIKDFIEPKDKNNDGSLSREEFIADEADKEEAAKRFDEANKNGDRALSKSEISDMIGAGDEVEKLKQAEKDKKKKKK